MFRSIATGLVVAMGTLSAGASFGEAREGQAQRPESRPAEEAGGPHVSFAPAPSVSEPYQRLFAPNQLRLKALGQLPPPGPPPPSSKVTCGLTMMLADPRVDEKMSRPELTAPGQTPNARTAPEPKVRRIEPTICRD